MAKTLYFTDFGATTQRGTSDAKLNGTAVPWHPYSLNEARGLFASGTTTNATVPTVTGPTAGVEVQVSATQGTEWLSEPLSADFTISGTITLNLWAHETSMNDNAAINAVIDKIDGVTGAVTQVAKTARTTEVALSTSAVNNFTVTPTSTAFKRGDRIRVRVFAADAGVMASPGPMLFTYSRSSAGAAGDSFITFTENLTFERIPGPAMHFDYAGATPGSGVAIGSAASGTARSQPFVATSALITEVAISVQKAGAPADNVVLTIETDNAGNPSGTVVATLGSISGSSITASYATYVISGLSVALTNGTTYHLVIRRSGAIDAANFYQFPNTVVTAPTALGHRVNNGSTWSGLGNMIQVSLRGTALSTYYLTNTDETAISGANLEKQATLTRGSGVVNSVTNTAAGPTAPIPITSSAGGTVLEWYTPQLQAFTFSGKAKFNARFQGNDSASNAILRFEIAVVNADGSGAVVLGSAGADYGVALSAGTTDRPSVGHIVVDDAAISLGQRLRFRIYLDDFEVVMVTGKTITVSYNGATPYAAGDSYVALPVNVTEYIPSTPISDTDANGATTESASINKVQHTVTDVNSTISETLGTRALVQGDQSGTATETLGNRVLAVADSNGGAFGPTVDSGSGFAIGGFASNTKIAQSFQLGTDFSIGSLQLRLIRASNPADNTIFEIQTDSGGNPSGTVLGTYTVASSAIPNTFNWFSVVGTIAGLNLSANTPYWIVMSRSGALDSGNSIQWQIGVSNPYADGSKRGWNGSTWGADFSIDMLFQLTPSMESALVTQPPVSVSGTDANLPTIEMQGFGSYALPPVTDYKFRLDASDQANFKYPHQWDANGFSQWKDASGYGNHADGGDVNGYYTPQYGKRRIEGFVVPELVNTAATGGQRFVGNYRNLQAAQTYFIVAWVDTLLNPGRWDLITQNRVGPGISIVNGKPTFMEHWGAGDLVTHPISVTPGVPFCVSLIYNTPNITLRLNTIPATGTYPAPTGWNPDGQLAGGQADTFPFTGLEAEIIMFDRALSPAEVDAMESYLKTKWGIPDKVSGDFSGATDYESLVLADDPLVYYRLDETSGTVAISETGANGTYVGSPTLAQAGALVDGNASVLFDGVNDQITLPSSITIPANSSITVEWWQYVATADVRAAVAFHIGLGGEGANDTLQAHAPFSDKVLYWDYGNIGVGGRVTKDYTPYLDKWTHVVLTYDATTNKHAITLDGVEVASNSIAVDPDSSLSGGSIGASNGSNFHKARMDEFAIYDYALTTTQRLAHYNAGKGIYGITEAASVSMPPVPISGTDANGLTTESVNKISVTADANGAVTESPALASVASTVDANGATTETQPLTAKPSSADANGVTTENAATTQINVVVSSDTNGATTETGSPLGKPVTIDANAVTTESVAMAKVAVDQNGTTTELGTLLTVTPKSDTDASGAVTETTTQVASATTADTNGATTEIGSTATVTQVSGSDIGSGSEVGSVGKAPLPISGLALWFDASQLQLAGGAVLQDDFNRVNASTLGTNWANVPSIGSNRLAVNGNEAKASGSTYADAWQAQSFGSDQEVAVTLRTVDPTGAHVWLLLQMPNPAMGSFTGYLLDMIQGSGTCSLALYRGNAGSYTTLVSTVSGITYATGDVWTLRKVGSALTVLRNGTPVSGFNAVVDSSPLNATSYVGTGGSGSSVSTFDDFMAGVPGAGTAVTEWPNISNPSAPGTMVGSPPPELQANAKNGLPVVRFTHDNGRVRMNGTTGVGTDYTLVYVGRIWGLVNGRVVNGIYTPANILFGWWTSYQDVAYAEGFTTPDMKVPFTNDWKMYSADGVSGLQRFLSDGTLLGTTATGIGWQNTFAISGYSPMGMEETCDCEVAEVLLFNRKLSDTERQQVEAYLRAKWFATVISGIDNNSGTTESATVVTTAVTPDSNSVLTEAIALAAKPITPDASVAANDVITAKASVVADQNAALTEATAIRLAAADQNLTVEATVLTANLTTTDIDGATGEVGGTGTIKSDTDTNTLTETASVRFIVSVVDVATVTDLPSLAYKPNVTDTGIGADAANAAIPVPVSATDSGQGSESASPRFLASGGTDTLSGADVASPGFSVARTDTSGTTTETTTVLRVYLVADSGTATDSALVTFIGIYGEDFGFGTDFARVGGAPIEIGIPIDMEHALTGVNPNEAVLVGATGPDGHGLTSASGVGEPKLVVRTSLGSSTLTKVG